MFEHRRPLYLLRDFTVFGGTGSGLAKIIGGYHQFHAVRYAVDSTAIGSSVAGNQRAGAIWHIQGSGKHLLMAFYSGQLVKHPAMEDTVARYHATATATATAEILQELIQLAKDIRAARQRGEEAGLSEEEVAFYDALAENDSAVQMMGDDKLKLIAHELLMSLRENVTVDWARRESARARMRVRVKRILRKYGYPPDLQDSAVQTVLQQAEALSAGWSVAQ